MARLETYGAPLPTAKERAEMLRARAVRLTPSTPREVLESVVANTSNLPAQLRATRRLARLDEANKMNDEADVLLSEVDVHHTSVLFAETRWSEWITLYANRISLDGGIDSATMLAKNPAFVVRPRVLEAVTASAVDGDFEPAMCLLKRLRCCFQEER